MFHGLCVCAPTFGYVLIYDLSVVSLSWGLLCASFGLYLWFCIPVVSCFGLGSALVEFVAGFFTLVFQVTFFFAFLFLLLSSFLSYSHNLAISV